MGCLNARCERSVMRRSDRLDLGDAEADGKPDMTRRLVAMATAAALLAFSAAPSFADHHGGGHGGGSRGWHGGGGNWNGRGWHGGGGGWHHGGHGGGWGVGPAIGLGLGLGLLGGALATAPYYSGYDYGYSYAPIRGHPHPRFGIGAIPIRGITLRYPNARFHGDKLFSNQRGMPLDDPLRCQAVYLLAPRATVVSTHRI
jgi:hypothetical protein